MRCLAATLALIAGLATGSGLATFSSSASGNPIGWQQNQTTGTLSTPQNVQIKGPNLQLGGAVAQGGPPQLQVDSTTGKVAIFSSSYSAQNTANGETIRAYNRVAADNPLSTGNVWNRYDESIMFKLGQVELFGNENTIYTRAVPGAVIDPYNDNQTQAAINQRLACGFGTLNGTITASSDGKLLTVKAITGSIYNGQVVTGAGIAADTEIVEQMSGDTTGLGTWRTTVSNTVASEVMTLAMDPKPCSAALHILTNGAKFTAGIVIGNDAITASGGLSPAMWLGRNNSIDWFSAAGVGRWHLYSSANAGNQKMILGNDGITIDTGANGTATPLTLTNSPNNSAADATDMSVVVDTSEKFRLKVGRDASDLYGLIKMQAAVNGVMTDFLAVAANDATHYDYDVKGNYVLNGKGLFMQVAPTIASGGCTTGSAQSVSASNGTAAFAITLGGATCGSTITLTMPTASAAAPVVGWVCHAHDITTPATNIVEQSAGGSATVVVLTNYVRTTGIAANFNGPDVIAVGCTAY